MQAWKESGPFVCAPAQAETSKDVVKKLLFFIWVLGPFMDRSLFSFSNNFLYMNGQSSVYRGAACSIFETLQKTFCLGTSQGGLVLREHREPPQGELPQALCVSAGDL